MDSRSVLRPAAGAPRDGVVVGALATTEIVSWGVLYYAFGVMVTPMQAELGWSQGLLGAAFSLALLVSALLAVPVGGWLERHGPRALMTVGSCMGVALVVAWSHVESPLVFFGLCLALGFPLAATLYEAAFAAVVGLIDGGRRRDMALLSLTVVAGLASTVFVPLTQWLVAEHGWRAALRILALVLGVITIPLHAFALARIGPPRVVASGRPDDPRPAIPLRRLRLTAAAFALATIGGTSLGVYLVPILIELGHSAGFAALATALIGVGQVVGRVGFTFLRPRYALSTWSLVLFVPGAVGLLVLAGDPPRALVMLAVLGFALSSGAQTLGRTTWALELFELASFARVNGVLGLWSLVGRAGAPLAIGAAHDVFGSHVPGLITLALLFGLGGLAARLATEA